MHLLQSVPRNCMHNVYASAAGSQEHDDAGMFAWLIGIVSSMNVWAVLGMTKNYVLNARHAKCCTNMSTTLEHL
jgi:predicted nucleic acid-binding Zn finger protein